MAGLCPRSKGCKPSGRTGWVWCETPAGKRQLVRLGQLGWGRGLAAEACVMEEELVVITLG